MTTSSKKTFGSTQALRDYLTGEGFPSIKKGAVRGELIANGRKARFGMGVIGKTGQSSTGAGWGFTVTIEEAA